MPLTSALQNTGGTNCAPLTGSPAAPGLTATSMPLGSASPPLLFHPASTQRQGLLKPPLEEAPAGYPYRRSFQQPPVQ